MSREYPHKYKFDKKDKSSTESVCTVCGCRRIVTVSYGFRSVSYIRSSQLFDLSPDCVDMAVENLKTID